MQCLVALTVLATLGMAIIALAQGRGQAKRLRALEARIEELTLARRTASGAPATASSPTEAGRAGAVSETGPTPPAAAPRSPDRSGQDEPAPADASTRTADASRPVEPGDDAIGLALRRPEAQPGPTPPPPAASAPLAPPPSRIDWEQWLGLKGAAVVGGVVLALAFVLLLKYGIDEGWFPPVIRVTAAMVAGAASLAISELLRRRGYPPAANGLAGAGVVILYAASWAAHSLYGLLGAIPAFALMGLVTVTAGLLAWRHRALVVAALGLAGGFATPLLLRSQQDHPIGLFGYLLLLDAGLVALARRRRWPVLAAVAVVATALYELHWLSVRMDAPRVALGLAIVAGFGALFALAGGRAGEATGTGWRLTRAGGVLLPAAFALLFAVRADLGPHLWPVAAMLALIGLAAGWLDRRGEGWRLAPAIAAGAVVTVLVWALRGGYAADRAWELTVIAVGLALVFRLPVEVARRRARPASEAEPPGEAAAAAPAGAGPTIADAVAAGGFLLVLAFAPLLREILSAALASLAVLLESGPPTAPLAAWLTGLLALGGLLWHQAADPGRPALHVLAGLGVGLGLALASAAAPGDGEIRRAVIAGLAVAVAVSVLALRRHRHGLRRPAEAAAIAVAALPLLALLVAPARYELTAVWTLGAALAFGLLGLLAATRMPSGVGFAGMTAALFAVQAGTTAAYVVLGQPPDPGTPLALLAAGALLCTLWPALAGRALADRPAAWIAAALAQPAWFWPLYWWWERAFGLGAIALLPLAQGTAALAGAFAARRLWPPGSARRRSALAWFGAVALGFAALAVPLQLEKEWITVAWALEGVAVIALWRRLDHPGLRLFGLALLAAVTVRLVANPLLLGYHEASGRFLWSWLSYTYLVPAAALLLAARWLPRPPAALPEATGAPPAAGRADRLGRAAATACGLAAVAVLFVWLNLAIFDAYSAPGGAIRVSIERQPARDLSMSLAWAVFALVLLALGIARSRVGLRKLGLGFLILTLCKVFLYDLGELEDLYRVASLVGLAISLLLVSLAYQRFVRGRERPEAAGGEPEASAEEVPAPPEPSSASAESEDPDA